MLDDLLKSVSPDVLAHAIRSNQTIVQATLFKFKAYRSFGEALSNSQQVNLSKNLDKLNDFFKTDVGREAIAIFGESFEEYCEK